MPGNKSNGYDIIQKALSQPDGLYGLSLKLVPGALEIGQNRIGKRSNPECNTEYTEGHAEIFIWALGLMCQEWILENFRKKSEDGHCWTHKKPCENGSEFHKNLFMECKGSFEDALKNAHAPR